MTMEPKRGGWVLVALLGAWLGGCSGLIWEHHSDRKADLGVSQRSQEALRSAVYRDSIGALCYYEGMQSMVARGYGLVIGLGKNGSRDCPKQVFEQVVRSMYKEEHRTGGGVEPDTITPERMIRDEDTAVVVVKGVIPPGATAGTHFDVSLVALPGTQTKSLLGGRLLPCDLVMHRKVRGKVLSGKVLGRAAGPVFSNPFAGGDAATRTSSLSGMVLGGGVAVRDRRVRLVLTQPSYAYARRIQDRINGRFSHGTRVADAISPSFIKLRVPNEFHEDIGHFLSLIRSLYLSSDPQFGATRALLLAKQLRNPTAPHAQIALAFEGIGRDALPVLKDIYGEGKDYVSFHAAVAGLRLGDYLACDAMIMHARNLHSPYRYQAIRALGQATDMAIAGMALRKLLYDGDPRVQIAAYEALTRRGDRTIESKKIAGDNFQLDHVPGVSPPFVYVTRSASRKIVVFGDRVRCSPPLLYRAPDGCVTITANSDDHTLTLLRRVVSTGTVSPPIPAPFEVLPLVELMGSDASVDPHGRVTGLGLDYGAVVRALYHLCRDGTSDIKFVLEQPNAAELFGPAESSSRPESEL